MQYCDKCGGPLRSAEDADGWFNVDGCRLCWLDATAVDVPRGPVEWLGWDEQGNSTADSPATSTWLPPGAREPVQHMSHERAMWIIQPWLE